MYGLGRDESLLAMQVIDQLSHGRGLPDATGVACHQPRTSLSPRGLWTRDLAACWLGHQLLQLCAMGSLKAAARDLP